MSLHQRLFGGLFLITLLTVTLVVMNVHSAVLRFVKDKDRARMVVYLGALALLGSIIIHATYGVFDQVMEAAAENTAAGDVSEK